MTTYSRGSNLFASILPKLLLSALTICKLFLPARNQQNLASMIPFASSRNSSATPIPLLSSSALSTALIILKAFPSRVSKNRETSNIPQMSFGLYNFSSLILSTLLISRTLGKKSTKPKNNSLVKFNSNALKIGKAPTTIVSSTTFPLTTVLFPVKNSAMMTITMTSLLTILPLLPTTNATRCKTKSRPNVQAAPRPLALSIHLC